jgi:SAM-dependent methyltransferase
VLDIGAGAGIHTLQLQERGLDVTALDITPEAVTVMRQRGVWNALCADVLSITGQRYDTLLLLGHGVGMAGDIPGLDRLLVQAHSLLEPDGQLLLDSLDVTCDPTQHPYHEANRQAGRYVGEVRMQFEYDGTTGPCCAWLHVDPETLGAHARAQGLTSTVILNAEHGEYLARLIPHDTPPNPPRKG